MGTWGVGLFESDIALDVRGDYERARREGRDVADATRFIMDEFEEALADTDDGPLIWLALAALQLDEPSIDPAVRREALEVLRAGADLDRWIEENSDVDVQAREAVLADLRQRLEYESPFVALHRFLDRLEQQSIRYDIRRVRPDSLMVQFATPGMRWEVEFMGDGSVEVERFRGYGNMSGADGLTELWQQLEE